MLSSGPLDPAEPPVSNDPIDCRQRRPEKNNIDSVWGQAYNGERNARWGMSAKQVVLSCTWALLSLTIPQGEVRAQGKAGSPAGSTPPSSNPNPSPGTVTRSPGTIPRMPNPGDINGMDDARSMFLSGKVVLSDAGVPPEPIVIERVCNGTARREAYTDSKGRFSFEVGNNATMVMQDATTSGGSYNPYGAPNGRRAINLA